MPKRSDWSIVIIFTVNVGSTLWEIDHFQYISFLRVGQYAEFISRKNPMSGALSGKIITTFKPFIRNFHSP